MALVFAAANPLAASAADTDKECVQRGLKTLGYYSGGIDNDFGAGTRGGLQSYQLAAGITHLPQREVTGLTRYVATSDGTDAGNVRRWCVHLRVRSQCPAQITTSDGSSPFASWFGGDVQLRVPYALFVTDVTEQAVTAYISHHDFFLNAGSCVEITGAIVDGNEGPTLEFPVEINGKDVVLAFSFDENGMLRFEQRMQLFGKLTPRERGVFANLVWN